MAIYSGKTASGLTYTATSVTLGVPFVATVTGYNVTITDSSGNVIEDLKNLSTGLNLLGVTVLPTGNVVTGSSDITILLGLVGATYVTIPGSTGSINIVANAASGNTYYIGGNTDINIPLNVLASNTINIYGGTATFSGNLVAGLLTGSTINIGYGGTYAGSVGLVNILGGSTVNFQTGGGTLILNADSQVLSLLANNGIQGVTFNNYDPSIDTIEIQNTSETITGYTISSGNSQKIITLYSGSVNNVVGQYAVNTATGVSLPDGTYDSVNSQDATLNPLQITYASGNAYIGACFLAGSMINTPDGACAVEELAVGDSVLVFEKDQSVSRQIVWTGRATAHVKSHLPDDEAGYPVRILKDAISSGVPSRDLLVTPEHCLYFEGNFIPARMLVNGRSIQFDRSVTTYEYYHVETAQHSVIMANAMLTESYLDTGNRSSFRPYGNVARIGAGVVQSWAQDAAAPLMVARHGVEPVYRQIEARAKAMDVPVVAAPPTLTEEADLHLVTEKGQILRKVRMAHGHAVFMVPGYVQTVRLVSRTSRPSDVQGAFVDDRRALGVRVGQVTFQTAGTVLHITDHLTDATLSGWAEAEAGQGRWTQGNALLRLTQNKPESFGMLSVRILDGGPYLVQESAGEVLIAQG